ncbi:autoinducer binding domain-containing protein [Candidatus Methylobacter oryzae]|uniref:LuxR family transcriptional regulator n=1 Tax=Candidatus Methylobacter oryzae TaxID=2497749 RepID=A0ABY3CCC2_9GAMM|nr:autoinducer binding domain-containing protein [Candidatus Methylobacter oryzae]TRW93193.1 LuxR family transcriptional regulator [Candidatus Methylobacter oryzae]
MKTWQENQLQALQSIQSEQPLFQIIASLGKELGFDYCTYGLRAPLPLAAPKTLIFSNYPTAWQAQYRAKNYLAIDPTVHHGMRSLLPILWTDNLFNPARELWEEAQSFGLRHGWAQSSHDFNGVKGMLTLARSNEPISDTELEDKRFKMAWLTQTAHLGMSRCLTPKLMPEADVKLSNREIAVLRWTADGKTSGEISDILKISERTVNFHIHNAITKLNATNKTSAAVKAAMLGFL